MIQGPIAPASFDLSGKVALVTGSSQGLGRYMAVGLAQAGADVLVTYRSSREDGEQTLANRSAPWAAGRCSATWTWPTWPPSVKPWSRRWMSWAAWTS